MSADLTHSIKNLLVVVDDVLSMPYLLEKALTLAAGETRVHVVQVIYEGVAEISTTAIEDSSGLKSFILESAEAQLEDALDTWQRRSMSLESATLWNARPWEGMLHLPGDEKAAEPEEGGS